MRIDVVLFSLGWYRNERSNESFPQEHKFKPEEPWAPPAPAARGRYRIVLESKERKWKYSLYQWCKALRQERSPMTPLATYFSKSRLMARCQSHQEFQFYRKGTSSGTLSQFIQSANVMRMSSVHFADTWWTVKETMHKGFDNINFPLRGFVRRFHVSNLEEF